MNASGILAFVYRSAGEDCSNNGISKTATKMIVVLPEGGPFKVSEHPDIPAVYIDRRESLSKCLNKDCSAVVQMGHDIHEYMFGGNYLHTSDSRFPADFPLPIFDRKERYS